MAQGSESRNGKGGGLNEEERVQKNLLHEVSYHIGLQEV